MEDAYAGSEKCEKSRCDRWRPEGELWERSPLKRKVEAKPWLSEARFAWQGLVEEELNRSFEAWDKVKDRPGAVSALANAVKTTDRWVLVYEGRVIVPDGFANKTKNPGHLKMLRSVMNQDEAGLSNALYVFTALTTGPVSECHDAPVLAVNKQFGYAQCGILFPNTYFGHGNLTTWRYDLEKPNVPWSDRIPSALWRGTVPAPRHLSCLHDFGNFARLQAIAVSHAHPHAVDAGCVVTIHDDIARSCVARGSANPCAGEPKPPPLPSSLQGNMTAFVKPWVPQANFSSYKFLLNLPGAKTGSYSRNLNDLWGTGAIVLFWNAPFVEWYFPALAHGRTHFTVTANTIVDVVEQLNGARGPSIERLRAAARAVHDTFLCPECIARYVRLVFKTMRAHFKMDAVLDDPLYSRAFFSHFLAPICGQLREALDEPSGSKRLPLRRLDLTDPVCGGGALSHQTYRSNGS